MRPVLQALLYAKRPVLIYGAGIHIAKAEEQARNFAHLLGIPVAPTWAALDIFSSADPLNIGAFGTHGTRAGNFAVQNSDLIIAVGTRLDTKATGTPSSTFARKAKIFVVDIDKAELAKFQHIGLTVEGICEDAKTYLTDEYLWAKDTIAHDGSFPDFMPWQQQIVNWQLKYPICPKSYYEEVEINPYVLVKELSRHCGADDIICSDTGCTVAWMAQAFDFKVGQRFLHAWNQTPMGYGLPAAVGAHYATGKRVVLVSGDGSFQMQNELATVAGRNLPIKIVLLNNAGHGMCRQTEREWFGGRHKSTAAGEGGLTFPKRFTDVAHAYRIRTWGTEKASEIELGLLDLMSGNDCAFFEALINPDHDVIPKLFATKPLEDMQPYLDREEFNQQMMVPLWEK